MTGPFTSPIAATGGTTSSGDVRRAFGLGLNLYGHSMWIDPGAHCTAGLEAHNRLDVALDLGTIGKYAISGGSIRELSYQAIANAVPSWGFTVPAGGTWPGTSRKGVNLVHTTENDYPAFADRTTGTFRAIDAKTLTGYQHSLRALLATLSSASRVEVETGTLSGAGWVVAGTTNYSGGTARQTDVNGDYAEVSVTPPSSGPLAGTVFLLQECYDPAVAANADRRITVDGALYADVTGASLTMQQITEPNGQLNTACFVATTISGLSAGAHTIRVTHTGTTGSTYLLVDAILVPSASPNPILVCEGTLGTVNAGGWSSAQRALAAANKTQIDAAYQAIVAEFTHARWVPAAVSAAGQWTGDGLHYNDRGMRELAGTVETTLLALLAGYDPDQLYALV